MCGETMALGGSWYFLLGGAELAQPAGACRCCDRNRKGSFGRLSGLPAYMSDSLRPSAAEEISEMCLASSERR